MPFIKNLLVINLLVCIIWCSQGGTVLNMEDNTMLELPQEKQEQNPEPTPNPQLKKFNLLFADSELKNIASHLLEAEEQYDVDCKILAGIIIHESGWGTSRLAKEKNNLAGLGAYPGNPPLQFQSQRDCIMYLAKLISTKEHSSVEAIGQWYAKDPAWASKVKSCVRMVE